MPEKDALERSVAFLQKRDGSDKLLKILRYSTQLLLTTRLLAGAPDARAKLKSFESSVGVSRKALRLGKFLQDIDDLRKGHSVWSVEGFFELIAYGGEGIYYFVEQFIWLVKTGAMDKKHGPRLQRISASFELLGYVGSVTLCLRELARLRQKEAAMTASAMAAEHRRAELRKLKGLDTTSSISTTSSSSSSGINGTSSISSTSSSMSNKSELQSEGAYEAAMEEAAAALQAVKLKMTLKFLSLIQDLSDSLIAVADIIDEKKQPAFLRSPTFLAGAGLLSALISAHKNWVSTR